MKKGFSLIETVIAIALMGVVIITVLGVFISGNNAIKSGRYTTVALNIGKEKIAETGNLFMIYRKNIMGIGKDEIFPVITSSGKLTVNPLPVTWSSKKITIEGTESIKNTGEYNFLIKIEEYVDSNYTGLSNLKKLTVTVTWDDVSSGGEKNVELKTLLAIN